MSNKISYPLTSDKECGCENIDTSLLPKSEPPTKQGRLFRKFKQAAKQIIQLSRGVPEGATRLHEFYYLEAIDNKHRYGNDTSPYFEVWKTVATRCKFLEWLSKLEKGEKVAGFEKLQEKSLLGPDGKPKTPIRQVTYLSPTDLPAYRLYKDNDDHLCTQAAGKLDSQIFSKENPYIFVVGRDEEIYVETYERGRIHHSSFFSGGAAISAGTAIFEDGKLTGITDKTGHYTVSKELIQKGFEVFARKGIDLSQVKVSLNAYTGCTKPREEYLAKSLLDEWLAQKEPYKLYKDGDSSQNICTKLTGKLGSSVNQKETVYDFVIGQDKEIYVDHNPLSSSTPFAGWPIISKGAVRFKDGKLVEIFNKADYRTISKELIQKGLKVFTEKGIDLSQVKVRINTYNGLSKIQQEHTAQKLLEEWFVKKQLKAITNDALY